MSIVKLSAMDDKRSPRLFFNDIVRQQSLPCTSGTCQRNEDTGRISVKQCEYLTPYILLLTSQKVLVRQEFSRRVERRY